MQAKGTLSLVSQEKGADIQRRTTSYDPAFTCPSKGTKGRRQVRAIRPFYQVCPKEEKDKERVRPTEAIITWSILHGPCRKQYTSHREAPTFQEGREINAAKKASAGARQVNFRTSTNREVMFKPLKAVR